MLRVCYTDTRNKNKDHYRSVARDRKRDKTEQWRRWKIEQGCYFCDEDFAPCLQLHHLDSDEKDSSVSDMVNNDASWERIMHEAAKGIVVCGNCHVKVHHGILTIGV